MRRNKRGLSVGIRYARSAISAKAEALNQASVNAFPTSDYPHSEVAA
jgi:hypothetical protein